MHFSFSSFLKTLPYSCGLDSAARPGFKKRQWLGAASRDEGANNATCSVTPWITKSLTGRGASSDTEDTLSVVLISRRMWQEIKLKHGKMRSSSAWLDKAGMQPRTHNYSSHLFIIKQRMQSHGRAHNKITVAYHPYFQIFIFIPDCSGAASHD